MDIRDLDPDPLAQFAAWKQAYSPRDDAACLATATVDGVPNARIVLVKGPPRPPTGGADSGFVFYTNRESAKGRELAANPQATLVFHWEPRSVRISGRTLAVSDAESDVYWSGRPRGSQLGAWASAQSSVIAGRDLLEQRLAEATSRFGDGEVVPRPAYWGGFRVVPTWMEFWQHQDDRLHDRIRYRQEDGAWVRERLSP